MTGTLTSEIATGISHTAADIETAPAKEAPKEKELKRQIVSFQFFQVMPEWRCLPAEERAAQEMLDRVG